MTRLSRGTIDILVLAILATAAYAITLSFSSVFSKAGLLGMALFTLPPIVYMGWRRPKPWAKIAVGTLLFGAAFGFFFEFFMEYSLSYDLPNALLPRLFTTIPIDNILAHMLMAGLTFVFYEHFVAGTLSPQISRRVRYAAALAGALVVGVIVIYYAHPVWFLLRYPYAYLGTLAIVPVFVLALRRPGRGRQLLMMVPYFFFLYLLMEVVAVRLHWWIYPGENYIGMVSLFHSIYFPIEEVFFWMLFYAAALTSYYALFIDAPLNKPTGKAKRA